MNSLFRRSPTLDELPVHRIDEEYSVGRSSRDFGVGSPRGSIQEPRRDSSDHTRPVTMSVQHEFYDPGERIPSYESSQEQHSRRPFRSAPRLLHDLSGVISSRELISERGRDLLAETPPVLTTTNMRTRSSIDITNSRTREREVTQSPARDEKRSLKKLGLKFLNARQHLLLSACRDFSLIPCVIGLFHSWWMLLKGVEFEHSTSGITAARMSEHFLTGVWCLVAGYLLYSVLDGLMVRWIVSYTTTGSIVRMGTMSAILVAVEQYLVSAFSAEGYNYALHTWILISCALTLLYIVQNFVTSNIDLKGKYRPRFFDFYNIVVFAVVPVGMASFITMIGLLRSLLILRLDVDQQGV